MVGQNRSGGYQAYRLLKSRHSCRISAFPDTRKYFSRKFNTERAPRRAAFQARRRPNVVVVGGQLKKIGYSENVRLPARLRQSCWSG